MTPLEIYGELTHLLDQLGVEVSEESFDEESDSKGGLCTVKGVTTLILNKRCSVEEKNRVILKALKAFDLEGFYVRPYLRDMLEME